MAIEINQLEIQLLFEFSFKAFCREIITQIDKLAGTNYFQLYRADRVAFDRLLTNIATIAKLHDLVVVVIECGPFELHETSLKQKHLKAYLDAFEEVTGIVIVFESH
jgi:hypothetical protein